MFVSVGSHSNVDDPDTTPGGVPPRRRARVHARGQVREGLRLRHSQLRRRSDQPDHRPALVLRPTSATAWATTWCPTTSPMCRKAASTAGPGSTWATTRTRGTRASIPSWRPRCWCRTCCLQPHFASLEMTFDEGKQFPAAYKGWAFAAEHGSWNKSKRAGYEVIAVPVRERQGHRRVRGLPDRLRHAGRQGVGTPGGRHLCEGRLAIRHRRWIEFHLARDLHRHQTGGEELASPASGSSKHILYLDAVESHGVETSA